ncbi:MAG: hypothetical protein EZS28_021944 [Streblomastix strix]|uniref:Uncharacterized protein n=1 Tax=Streblomastix strix TaxID=222440 RepID=A0A5J4VIQ8_9EUKA|nr:MAG: hypothetical protein EZS28_021944 [Streblomastix strix]
MLLREMLRRVLRLSLRQRLQLSEFQAGGVICGNECAICAYLLILIFGFVIELRLELGLELRLELGFVPLSQSIYQLLVGVLDSTGVRAGVKLIEAVYACVQAYAQGGVIDELFIFVFELILDQFAFAFQAVVAFIFAFAVFN